MPVTLGSNIASLRAQRVLGTQSDRLSQVFERLSSGQRINRASDDAAGLAVASGLNAKSRVFGQAVRNLNDGISALSIADQAIANLSEVVIRQRELATQSANGSLSDEQRESLNEEAQELSNEYQRILATTEFNGTSLLDGSLSGIALQAGIGENAILDTDILGILSSSQEVTSFTADDEQLSLGNDLPEIGTPRVTFEIADMNSDGRDDLIVLYAQEDFSQDEATFTLATYTQNSDGSFTQASEDTVSDIALNGGLSGNVALNVSGSNILIGLQETVGGSSSTYTYSYLSDGTLTAPTPGSIGGSVLDLGRTSYSGDLNGDGINDSIAVSDVTRRFISSVSQIETVESGEVRQLTQSAFSLATRSQALSALDQLETDLTTLTDIRSEIGAGLSRVNAAINVLGATKENFTAAEARIRDADIASESSALTRLGILQQAGAAVLAQANVQPQLALSLI